MSTNNKKIDLKTIAYLAIFIALQTILSRIFSIRLPFVTIGLGFIANTIVAISYGKYASMVVSGLADVMGALILPIGPFFPGYTFTALISGYIRGAGFHKKKLTFKRIFITIALNQLLTSLLLNTFWMFIVNDRKNFLPILFSRLSGVIINTLIQVFVTFYLKKSLFNRKDMTDYTN